MKIQSFFHFALVLATAGYGVMVPENPLDYGFMLFVLCVFIGWTIFDGHCPLTLATQKTLSKTYRTSLESVDLLTVFGDKEYFNTFLFLKIVNCFQLLSIYNVFTRNGFPVLSLVPFAAFYGLSYLQNKWVNGLFFLWFGGFFVYVILRISQRLQNGPGSSPVFGLSPAALR